MKKKALLIITAVLLVVVSATALFACKPTEYTVTFELGGGEMQESTLTVKKGEALDLSAYTPTRAGYTFGGWTDENGIAVTLTVINSDVTFTAVWQAAENSVTYYVGGEVYRTESALTGVAVTPVRYETDAAGEFFGWFTDENMTARAGDTVTIAPGGTDLYGAFIGEEYFTGTFEYRISGGEAVITGLKDALSESIFIPSYFRSYTVRIGAEAFRNLTALKTIYLGESALIDGGAFAGSGVESVICAGENYRVSNGALYNGHTLVFVLASTGGAYEISEGTEKIAAYAFAGNKNLTSVTLPVSLTEVGARIFADCGDTLKIISKIKITDGRTGFDSSWNYKNYTGSDAYECEYATDGKENGYLYTITDGAAYIFSYEGNDADIVLPVTLGGYPVRGVGAHAFTGTNISSVVLHDGIEYVGVEAFAECANLQSVIFEGADTDISYYAFAECTGLTIIVLPYALSVIPEGAFEGCISLKEITLPQTLEIIGEYAFMYTAVKEITIPASVISIGDSAFESTMGEDPSRFILFKVVQGTQFDWNAIVGNDNYKVEYI